jgi:hypothetical protein
MACALGQCAGGWKHRHVRPNEVVVFQQLGVLGSVCQGQADTFKCHRSNGSLFGSRVEGQGDLEDTKLLCLDVVRRAG